MTCSQCLPAKADKGNVCTRIFCSSESWRNYWGPVSSDKKRHHHRPIFFFLRDELDIIVAAKLVLKHYKHSDPTKPVELLMYR